MPLLQYFGWVGSVLLAALFAAGWWLPGNLADAPRPRTPLSESIHIRIRSDHKWPERVVFDTTRPGLAADEYAQAQTEPQDHPAGSKTANAFTAPNPFRRPPGKS
jgi:hypothetical protein